MQAYRRESMSRFFWMSLLILIGCQCSNKDNSNTKEVQQDATPTPYEEAIADPMVEFRGSTVDTRFKVPKGYERGTVGEETFANYLRKLPLKVPGSQVKYHNGETKSNPVHAAVIDIAIGDKDLHQCADAIMRLQAEYLWMQGRYDEIHFNFTNGMRVDYSKWIAGQRIKVDGNKTSWYDYASPSNNYKDFWDYMEQIFMYAGTSSLSKELSKVSSDDIQIGDIFIQGGHPGHAVIVVDLAEHSETGKKVMMVAQSFMPAQELHILKNNDNRKLSPWYEVDSTRELILPEWSFKWTDLKRFKE